jgi:hypothetical protein
MEGRFRHRCAINDHYDSRMCLRSFREPHWTLEQGYVESSTYHRAKEKISSW